MNALIEIATTDTAIRAFEETAERVARSNAANPFLNRKRFAIQVWHGDSRADYHAPTLALAETLIRPLAKPDDPNRPDKVTFYDNVLCLRVRDWRKSSFGYSQHAA